MFLSPSVTRIGVRTGEAHLHNHLLNHLQLFAYVVNPSEQRRGRPKGREEEPAVGVGTLQRSSGTSLQEGGTVGWLQPGSSPLRFRARRPWKGTATGPRLERAAGDTQCTSFSALQLIPAAGAAAWRCGLRGSGAGGQQLFCWAAGGGAAPAHRPLSSAPRGWEGAVSGALFLGLSIPQLPEERLCVSLSPMPGQGRQEGSAEK